ncbi:MAG TPA: hypothetical protein RMF84_14805, partial [Polyangiaceae bacterium LLY-WYZ-14_1]|nr:hypothetical protein [Polyangiaceae bacterium LLY-WYZ-14_1]
MHGDAVVQAGGSGESPAFALTVDDAVAIAVLQQRDLGRAALDDQDPAPGDHHHAPGLVEVVGKDPGAVTGGNLGGGEGGVFGIAAGGPGAAGPSPVPVARALPGRPRSSWRLGGGGPRCVGGPGPPATVAAG